jgi:hypothetical protein
VRERLGFGEFNEHSEKEITFELHIRESGYQSLTFCHFGNPFCGSCDLDFTIQLKYLTE